MACLDEWVEWSADPCTLLLSDGRRVEVRPGDELLIEMAVRHGEPVAVFTDYRKRQVH